MAFATTLSAQIVLPPKPKVEESKKERKPRLEATPLDLIPAKGWYFESGVGTVVWGKDSQCRCNALTADIGFQHVSNNGFLIGTNLLLTNTISTTVSPTLKIGYQTVRRKDRSMGNFSVSVLAGPSISNFNRGNFINTEDYSGYTYGGELNFQPRLGRYSQLRGIMAVGWLTSRETFTQDTWNGPTTTRITHSGFRIRLGLIL